MAQLVARLVRNEKVGGSNPPSSTTGRHPIADVGFLCAWARWCGALLPLVFWAPHVLSPGPGCFVCPWAAARPLAVRAASFARRVVSKPGQAPPPPTGTAARPCRHPRAPWLCPPVPPVPSTPVAQPEFAIELVACGAAGVPGAFGPGRPRLATHVKPSSPLLACALPPVKPTTPLQARYPRFRRNFGEQRRHGFHGGVLRLPQWG